MSNKIRTVPIKRKNKQGQEVVVGEYVQVDERVRLFREMFPEGSIETTLTHEGNFVRCRAVVRVSKEGLQVFTGHAEEDRTQGYINATNAVENCETSAVGRALGFMNIGNNGSIASADEMQSAIQKQENKKVEIKNPNEPASDAQIKMLKGLLDKYGMPREEFMLKYAINDLSEMKKGKASSAIDELSKRTANEEKWVASVEADDSDIKPEELPE